MTHETREERSVEVEELKNWIETALDADAHGKWHRAPNFNVIQDVAELMAPRFHHQLQKARQDWLQEEIVRLKGMRRLREYHHYDEKTPTLDEGWNQALQTIIDRYQAELDQDNK